MIFIILAISYVNLFAFVASNIILHSEGEAVCDGGYKVVKAERTAGPDPEICGAH